MVKFRRASAKDLQPMLHGLKKRPRDPNQLGKLIVDIATGQVEDRDEARSVHEAKRAAGVKGGSARAQSLTPERRSEIASVAAKARWED